MPRYLRLGLLGLGVALFGVLVARSDPAAIASSLGQLSWRLLVVLCFPIAVTVVFDTLGWRYAFARDRTPFRALLGAGLAGDAFNTTTATIGGEAVKAWLLRSRVPLDESVASLIVSNTTVTIAQGIFLLIAILLARTTTLPRSPVFAGMEVLLGIEIVATAGFVATQTCGLLRSAGRLLERLGAGAPGGGNALARVDHVLVQFYREDPSRFARSIAWHFLGWLGGSIEAYLILRFLRLPVSLATATVVEAFGTAVRFASFVIPASLGAVEGGYVAIFAALGLGSPVAIAFSLVKRAREATWVAVGLIVFALMRTERAWPATSTVARA